MSPGDPGPTPEAQAEYDRRLTAVSKLQADGKDYQAELDDLHRFMTANRLGEGNFVPTGDDLEIEE